MIVARSVFKFDRFFAYFACVLLFRETSTWPESSTAMGTATIEVGISLCRPATCMPYSFRSDIDSFGSGIQGLGS